MMRHRHFFPLAALIGAAVILLAANAPQATAASVTPPAVRLLVPNILEGAVRELAPRLNRYANAPLDIEYLQMSVLADRLNKGERADVAMLTRANIHPLVEKGRVKSQVDVVQSALGIAVADGKPLPPMKTEADLIAFIRSTPSIALFGTGASGAALMQFAERNGIADILKNKATIITEGNAGTLLRDGRVASAMQQVAELKFGGANNVVPLPESLQTRPVSAVIVLADSASPGAAARVAKFLASAEAVAAYRRAGLTPVIK